MSAQEDLLKRAHTAYLTFSYDSEERRMIEYISNRLTSPLISEDDIKNHALLAARLHDIIRTRQPGALI